MMSTRFVMNLDPIRIWRSKYLMDKKKQ